MQPEIWQSIMSKLQEQICEDKFTKFFLNSKCISQKNDILNVQVPNITKFESIELNKNFANQISIIAKELLNKNYKVKFSYKYQELMPTPPKNQTIIEEMVDDSIYSIKLNPEYTFNSFIPSIDNKFIYEAAKLVANKIGKVHNPLFLYGDSGVGKTHLMQAIGNFAQGKDKRCKVYYTESKDFVNECISSFKHDTTDQFRRKYRSFDLLLIDDIHRFPVTGGTTDEFFVLFNYYYENKKQIVLTSDIPPKSIPGLEDRLVTRFCMGLVSIIKMPDFETRVSILKNQSLEKNNDLTEDIHELRPDDFINEIIFYIAENITSDIRSLQGALRHVLSYILIHREIYANKNFGKIQDILSDKIQKKNNEITQATIRNYVCKQFGITVEMIRQKTRISKICFPRHIAIYLTKVLLPYLTHKEIATFYGNTDHTTVMNAIKVIKNKMLEDGEFKNKIDLYKKEIKGIR